MEECEDMGYGEGVSGLGFASIVWDLVCIMLVGEYEACEEAVDRGELFVIAEVTVLGRGGGRLDACGSGEWFLYGGDVGLFQPCESIIWPVRQRRRPRPILTKVFTVGGSELVDG